MSTTVDLIPLLPGESPDSAIARIYDGGLTIRIDTDSGEGWIEPVDEGIDDAPPDAFDEWRAEVLRRLHALHTWRSEDVGGYPHLWSERYGWQVEFGRDDITLRWRGANSISEQTLDDETFLAAFDGLRTILHWPQDHGSYADLDDPEDRPTLIG